MDENVTVKPGDGWVNATVLWLVDELVDSGTAVRMVRWRSDVGVDLLREEGTVPLAVLDRRAGWRRASDEEVQHLMEQLLRTPARDAVAGLQQRAREQGVADEGRARDREALARRAASTHEVPAAAKSYWGVGKSGAAAGPVDAEAAYPAPLNGPQFSREMREADRVVFDEHDKLPATGSDAPMEVTFPHNYPERPDRTSDCKHGCGCWAGPSRSGGPDGVDPLGDCPAHPDLLAAKRSPFFRAMLAEGMDQLDALHQAVDAIAHQHRTLALALEAEDLGTRLIFHARDLRRAAGVSDEEHAKNTMIPTTED